MATVIDREFRLCNMQVGTKGNINRNKSALIYLKNDVTI